MLIHYQNQQKFPMETITEAIILYLHEWISDYPELYLELAIGPAN